MQREILNNAEKQYALSKVVADSTIDRLISISDDSSTIDSIKVEIVHFFGKSYCDKCINYLIEHIQLNYNYGDGISDIDQYNQDAALNTLGIMAQDKNKRWYLVPFVLNALRTQRRTEWFIGKLCRVLYYISDKKTAKSILESELKRNKSEMRDWNDYNYEVNLRLMLKQLE